MDKGIIFSASMVRALLDGRKTQTRRLIAWRSGNWHGAEVPDDATWAPDNGFKPDKRVGQTWSLHSPYLNGTRLLHGVCKVPYAPGDRLYVREAWGTWGVFDDLAPSKLTGNEGIAYVADYIDPRSEICGRLRPSIHMPRWASRLTLLVTDVRVQRVQEISEEDARAEGLGDQDLDGMAARGWFRDLWNSLHAKPGETWADNPFVVAVSFEVHHGNIDHLSRPPGDTHDARAPGQSAGGEITR